MAQLTVRRMWMKCTSDNLCFPQFDPDGKEHIWKESAGVPITKIMFVPLTREFADKIISHDNLAVPSNLPILEIPVNDGDLIKYGRQVTLRRVPHTICSFCGTELGEGVEAVCPKCFATNYYYCDRCDEFKHHPPRDKNGTALCPDCSEPRGLMYTRCIFEHFEEKYCSVGLLDVGDTRHLIIDDVRA